MPLGNQFNPDLLMATAACFLNAWDCIIIATEPAAISFLLLPPNESIF